MQLKYSYWFFKNAISKENCNRIIETGLSSLEKSKSLGLDTRAITYGHKEKQSQPNAPSQGEMSSYQLKQQGITESYIRDSEVAWLNDQWIYDLLFPYINFANISAGWNWQWDYAESLQFTVYHGNEKNGGFYGWHKDGPSDHFGAYKRYIPGISLAEDDGRSGYVSDNNFVGKVRKISMTLNLSESGSFEGGNLKFDFGYHSSNERFYECEEIRPQGSLIVFPSFLDHCVTPVTSGTRYSLVMWVLGEPFK